MRAHARRESWRPLGRRRFADLAAGKPDSEARRSARRRRWRYPSDGVTVLAMVLEATLGSGVLPASRDAVVDMLGKT
jgi:hypothetical protein